MSIYRITLDIAAGANAVSGDIYQTRKCNYLQASEYNHQISNSGGCSSLSHISPFLQGVLVQLVEASLVFHRRIDHSLYIE